MKTSPTRAPLVDSFGRVADDLRISVTDRCNFRCTYCMPAEGLAWLPRSELLTFAEMTRRDALEKVMTGVRAADAAGLTPIKINCVLIGGQNDDEVVEFARWSRETGHLVRFIEYMPLDAEHSWERAKVVASIEVLERIAAVFPLEEDAHPGEPATTYRFADGAPGGVGVIASVTEPFCDTCNRLRLTAEGQFRSCLFSLDEVDLRGPLRSGAEDDELAELIRGGVERKWAGGRINHPDFVRPDKSMSMIGG